MATRVKVTYIAMDEYKPILSASSFEAIREGLDDYEGHYSYSYTMKQYDKEVTNIDVVKIYCVNYHPHTMYEI